ncbi:MAG: hypothetical protein KDE53_03345 [Caldilineaceae bacterium]|nr:hypothetical protein [Caldilineaceae bacterium]
MHFLQPANPAEALATLDRLCRHYDHLKALVREYRFMRQQETYGRMADPHFHTDRAAMDRIDSPAWLRTSLIVRLPTTLLAPLFAELSTVYGTFRDLIHHYYPDCEVDSYVDSAHITIKTIAGDCSQSADDLHQYLTIIRPLVHQWLAAFNNATSLYAVGLFSSLNRERGLALGLRFYPSLPVLQIIRGAVGMALYEQATALPLRPEHSFHTTLIHSTGFRARLTTFPLHPAFTAEFRTLLEHHDRHLFGQIDALTPADFILRHGYSDQLIPLVELPCT